MADDRVYAERIATASLGTALLAAGTPIELYGFHAINGAGGATVVTFHPDGTGDADAYLNHTVADGTVVTKTYPYGILFASGCFVDIDSGDYLTSITVFYKKLV